MAIKDAWRFDKSQWALKAGIASALVLATIVWYARECGPVFWSTQSMRRAAERARFRDG